MYIYKQQQQKASQRYSSNMESKLVHLCNTPSTPWDLLMWSSVYNIKLLAWLISIHLYQPAIMTDKYFKMQPLKTTNT